MSVSRNGLSYQNEALCLVGKIQVHAIHQFKGVLHLIFGFVVAIWLLIILEAGWAPTALVENLIKEDRELACILGASIRTARGKALRISR